MKIKFLKPFRLYNPIGDDMMMGEGTIEDIKEDYAEWLIDNGFAKEFQNSGWWKPKLGDIYYVVYPDGLIASCTWDGCTVGLNRFLNGAVFKTKEATRRWRDYLKAIATVRQDEGVLTPEQIWKHGQDDYLYYVYTTRGDKLDVFWLDIDDYFAPANAIYFDSKNAALASLDKHPDEWKTIVNYDWSRE